jgi:hypothetical protein
VIVRLAVGLLCCGVGDRCFNLASAIVCRNFNRAALVEFTEQTLQYLHTKYGYNPGIVSNIPDPFFWKENAPNLLFNFPVC